MKLYLTIGVSIASCERSFSNLKIIKPYLRSTMKADRLSALSIFSIERDYVQKLNFEDIVADFTSAKARKVQFWGEHLSFIFLIHLFTIFYFWLFLKQYRTFETRNIICNYSIKKIAWTWYCFKICYSLLRASAWTVKSVKFCMGGSFCSLDQTHAKCDWNLVKILL